MSNDWNLETKAVQSGYDPKNGESRITPIVQSTTFKYDTAEEVGKLFDLEADGFFYTRLANPTTDVLEKKIAAMDGGVAALALASGQAASLTSVLNICQTGQNIIAVSTIYGGTYALFDNTLKKMGIEVRFVDPEASEAELSKVCDDNTRAIFGETLANPFLNILDFEKFSKIAKKYQIPLIVDNTFATPILCRPLEHGADIVTYSSTKYLDGHATSVGGLIVDGGKFDWNNGKFPELTEPDSAYHGLVYTKHFGPAAYVAKARVQLLRDMGNCLSPFNAFLTNIGVETLPLRMQRHSENALKVAEYLRDHEAVAWVNYPGLADHQDNVLATRYLSAGCSGVLSFGLKGGAEAGKKFIDSVKLATLVVHVADVRTGVLHPASMTHRQLSDQQLVEAGAPPELIRFSVGLENINDIIADLEQALAKLNY